MHKSMSQSVLVFIAAVANYHKLSDLKERKFIFSLLMTGGHKCETSFTTLKSRCRQGCIPYGASEEIIHLPFLVPSSCLYSTAPSSIFSVHHPDLRFHHHIITMTSPQTAHIIFMRRCGYTGSSRMFQDKFPIS